MLANSGVSIVIPAHNEEQFLSGLLASLEHYAADLPQEIVVVDNGSRDGTADIALKRGCRLVKSSEKLNPSTARNLGVKHAQGDVIVFLDADVEVTSEWAAALRRALPTLRNDPFQLIGDQYHISKHPGWIEKAWFRPMRARQPSYINGGNLITTRSLYQRLQGFDTDLETGEDVDFCERAKRNDARIVIDTDFKVFHEGYPKSVSRFVRRERWHGAGDFKDLRRVLQSRVALATLIFMLFHVVLAGALAAAAMSEGRRTMLLIAAVAATCILAVCAVSSIQKFSRAPLRSILSAVPVMYLYYFGRSWAAIDAPRISRSAKARDPSAL